MGSSNNGSNIISKLGEDIYALYLSGVEKCISYENEHALGSISVSDDLNNQLNTNIQNLYIGSNYIDLNKVDVYNYCIGDSGGNVNYNKMGIISTSQIKLGDHISGYYPTNYSINLTLSSDTGAFFNDISITASTSRLLSEDTTIKFFGTYFSFVLKNLSDSKININYHNYATNQETTIYLNPN